MINCKICDKEFKNLVQLSGHIRSFHKINIMIYYLKYINSNNKCPICGQLCNFKGLGKGFTKTCSASCGGKHGVEKRKRSSLERYGVECTLQAEETKIKTKKTFQKRYGVDHVSRSKKIRDRAKHTMIEKYGVEYSGQSSEIRTKMKQTNLKRYGVENPLQSKEIRDKIKKTNLELYGVENVGQNKDIKSKIKKTNLNRHGVECVFQSEKVKEKIKNTNLKKYGVEHASNSKEIRDKIEKTNLKKYGVKTILQLDEIIYNTTQKRRSKFFTNLINSDRLKNKCAPNFTENDFQGVDFEYSWNCIKCGNDFNDSVDNGKIPRCSNCYPKLNSCSKGEKEIFDFCRSILTDDIEIIENDRSVLIGKELDVYILSNNLAIEYNGLYWHSDLNGKNKDYHLDKTYKCKEKGINLLHVFEDEWIDKLEIVKSIIKNKLGLTKYRVFARKCTIKEVANDNAQLFLFDNHIQGSIKGTQYGLYFEDELVSILTIGKSRYNKKYEYEILRFCNKINTSVVGGFSKLLKYFKTKYNPKSIITYCDLRYGTGEVYLKNGFSFTSKSKPSYYYVKNGDRSSRIKFQKHKLKNLLESFDSNLTEWQNMQLNGYDRIWDCGCNVYTL